MRGQTHHLGLQLLRGMKRRPAEHDRHAAADRRIRRQAAQRIRTHDPDQVRIDLQHLADHGRGQRLVALARRCRVDGRSDEAEAVDIDAAGIHPGRGNVLLVKQGSRQAATPMPAHSPAARSASRSSFKAS
jgi:hypothetical protein